MRIVGPHPIPSTGEDRRFYSTADSSATANQTVFNVNYDEGKVAVFLNGIRLVRGSDFTCTNSGVGTQITLQGSGIASNDYLEVVGYQGIYSGNALVEDRFVVGTSSTGSGGAYTNSTTVFPVASVTGDLVCVYRNGIKLVHTTDFTVQPTANTVTLQSASNTADEITVHVIGILQHSNFVPTSGGTFTGTVAHTGTLDVSGGTLTTSTAQKTAIVDGGKGNLTKSDVGLSNVTNDAQVPASGGTFSGNVGIGASPDTKLNIVQSSTGRSWSPSGGQGDLIVERNGNAGISIVGANGSTSNLNFGNANDENAGFISYNHGNNSMSLRTNGSGTDLTIDSSGNCGVGYSSPSSKLHVNGALNGDILKLTGVGAESRGVTVSNFQVSGVNGVGVDFDAVGSGGVQGTLSFSTNSTERMRITSAGDCDLKTGSYYATGSGEGIYLGGVNSQNQLTEYEANTYTITCDWFNSSANAYQTNIPMHVNYNTASYVKIGSIVHVNAYVIFGSTQTNGGATALLSLPFPLVSLNQLGEHTCGSAISNDSINSTKRQLNTVADQAGVSYFKLYSSRADGTWTSVLASQLLNRHLLFQLTYRTSA